MSDEGLARTGRSRPQIPIDRDHLHRLIATTHSGRIATSLWTDVTGAVG